MPHYWLICFSVPMRMINSLKEGKRKLARKLNVSYCYYIDDLISFNNKKFNDLDSLEVNVRNYLSCFSICSSPKVRART